MIASWKILAGAVAWTVLGFVAVQVFAWLMRKRK